MGKPLISRRQAYAYSNFGYCVLAGSSRPFGEATTSSCGRRFSPVGHPRHAVGKDLLRTARKAKWSIMKAPSHRRPSPGRGSARRPPAYGVECIETMMPTAAGSPRRWTCSASPSPWTIETMPHPERASIRHARAAAGPAGHGPRGGRSQVTTHVAGRSASAGNRKRSPSGTAVCSPAVPRCWSAATTASTGVLFNSDAGRGKEFASLIDPLLHKPASEIKDWPEIDLFPRSDAREYSSRSGDGIHHAERDEYDNCFATLLLDQLRMVSISRC